MQQRNYAIDFIRLAAILAVVVIHTSTYFLDRTPLFSFNFYFLHFVNQFFRFAVPAFFAISGFLLASRYNEITNPITFYKKRFSKILLPYLSWSLIYFLLIFPNPPKLVVSNIFIHDLLTGDASYQLYFIPAIIVLYLLFPFIIKFKQIFLNKGFIVILFLVEAIVQSYIYFWEPKIDILAFLPIGFFNLLPFILGIYGAAKINDIGIWIKQKFVLFEIIAIFSFVLILSESIFMFVSTLKPMYLRDQWRISIPIYGISITLLLYNFYNDRFNKITAYLSSFSFGVFFVHAAILHNILKVMYSYKLFGLIDFVVALMLTIILSFGFSIFLSKIKPINQLLGLRA